MALKPFIKKASKTNEITTFLKHQHSQVNCLDPCTLKKAVKTNVKSTLSSSHALLCKITPMWPQDSQRLAPGGPKSPSSPPNIAPGCPKIALGCPKMAPRWTTKPSSRRKIAPRLIQDRSRCPRVDTNSR